MSHHVDIHFDESTMVRLEASIPEATCDQVVVVTNCGKDIYNPLDFGDHPVSGRNNFRKVFQGLHQNLPNNPKQRKVAVKLVRGPLNVELLRVEAYFYQNHLGTLVGTVVPRFYGFFGQAIDNGHTAMACMLLEWCDGEPKASAGKLKLDAISRLHANHIRIGLPFRSLSQGLEQEQDSLEDHFVYADNGMPMVIGFKFARMHDCRGYPGTTSGEFNGCEELERAHVEYGMNKTQCWRYLSRIRSVVCPCSGQ